MEFSLEYFTKVMEDIFKQESSKSRGIRLYTGAGGMDLIDESLESELGWGRVYINKAPRFIKLKTSYAGKKYKRYRTTTKA